MVPVDDLTDIAERREVALRLDYMIGQITPEEFQWQDANYDHDVALGRELLFLIANDDWIKATSETITISRSDTIDTEISVNIDFQRFTHEVFRNRSGPWWLPILVLPPVRQELPAPDPISTLTVNGPDGIPLAIVAHADVRHRVAAALAEVILRVAEALLPEVSAERFGATRDHQLLLSAAIYRLLRAEHVPSAVVKGSEPARQPGTEPLTPLDRIRNELAGMLASYAGLLADEAQPGQGDVATARQLTVRAIRVLRAFSQSAVVVVAADWAPTPTTLTVAVPGRALHLAPTRWERFFGPFPESAARWVQPDGGWLLRPRNWVLPTATIHLALLVPSANADRQIQVKLPHGISPDPSRPLVSRASLDIRTVQPQPVTQLAMLMSQFAADPDLPPVVGQCLADLATAKADAAWASLRDHQVGPQPGQPPMTDRAASSATRAVRDRLDGLGKKLRKIAATDLTTVLREAFPAAREALVAAWDSGVWLTQPMQRRTSMDMVSPEVVAGRARVIEDVGQRAAPTEARMTMHVAVTDSEYFSTARLSGVMSGALMTVVLAFFAAEHALRLRPSQISAEALVLVLTLFTALQASRIDRPDRSTIRGLLVPVGYPLIVASILPPVLLAVALAFSLSMIWAITCAAAGIVAQILLLAVQWLLLWRAFARGRRSDEDRSPGTGRVLYTDAPDYTHLDVLHSTWWRATTADALTSAYPAYGYMVWQRGTSQSTFRALLHGARPDDQPRQSRFGLQRLRRIQFGEHLPGEAAGDGRQPDGKGRAADADGSSQRRTRPVALGNGAQHQPANVVALQRWGTTGQLMHFVVFRDEPKPDWHDSAGDIVPVNLEPGLLAPVPDGTGSISVLLGIDPGLSADGQQHPVTAVLRAAGKRRFIVGEVQMPVPPPTTSYADLRWARVRINLRSADLEALTRFVTDVYELAVHASDPDSRARAVRSSLVIGIQTRDETLPRILNPRLDAAGPAEEDGSSKLLLASDLDAVPAAMRSLDAETAGRNWRIMAICAPWQIGIESQILTSLDPHTELVGVQTAILYGRTVVLLLGHRKDGHSRQETRALAAWPGQPTIYLDEWQAADDLGTAPSKPVLRVRMRTPDRPGATLDVLESLRDAFSEKARDEISIHDWDVGDAKITVPDGHLAHVNLTIVLPTEADRPLNNPIGRWTVREFAEIERRTLMLTAQKMAAIQTATDPLSTGLHGLSETVIRIELLDVPQTDPYYWHQRIRPVS